MELLDQSRSVLLVIDIQGKLAEAVHRADFVRAAAIRLLRMAQLFDVPVLLTEQYAKGLGSTHPEIRAAFDALTVPKRTLDKTSFGCCGDASFALLLDEVRPRPLSGPRQVVVAGIETHICVTQTVIELLRGGEHVFLCWDAVSGRGEEYRKHALERMAAAGAVMTNHESVGFEWARDKNHPRFKELSNLLKEGQLTG